LTSFVGLRFVSSVGLGIRDLNFNGWRNCSGWITDVFCDCRTVLLRNGQRGHCDNDENESSQHQGCPLQLRSASDPSIPAAPATRKVLRHPKHIHLDRFRHCVRRHTRLPPHAAAIKNGFDSSASVVRRRLFAAVDDQHLGCVPFFLQIEP
jgi:hypothetical protein